MGGATLLENLQPLLAIPEFKGPLSGGQTASQNDIFVLAHSASGPVTIMVEGKVPYSLRLHSRYSSMVPSAQPVMSHAPSNSRKM